MVVDSSGDALLRGRVSIVEVTVVALCSKRVYVLPDVLYVVVVVTADAVHVDVGTSDGWSVGVLHCSFQERTARIFQYLREANLVERA